VSIKVRHATADTRIHVFLRHFIPNAGLCAAGYTRRLPVVLPEEYDIFWQDSQFLDSKKVRHATRVPIGCGPGQQCAYWLY
jgi:hypothetical protein